MWNSRKWLDSGRSVGVGLISSTLNPATALLNGRIERQRAHCDPTSHLLVKNVRARRASRARARGGAAALIALALLLVACGGSDSDENTAKKDLTIGSTNIPATLDPSQNFNQTELAVMGLTGGNLTTISADGDVEMGLAASIQPGEDKWRIELKPDLKFSDGSPLTSADVAASLNFYTNDDANGYATNFLPISEVRVVDDVTVSIGLNYAYPDLGYTLALPQSAIIPAASIEAKGSSAETLYAGDPLPTAGQFEIRSITKDQVVLQANPNYWGPAPSVETLTFRVILDPNARVAQLQSGQLDYAEVIPPKQFEQFSDDIDATATIAGLGQYAVGFNNRASSLLADARIRQAVSLAIDRDQINQVAQAGKAPPALGLFSESSPYYEPVASASADAAEAKAVLAGSACADGCTLTYLVNSDDQAALDMATVIQQNLKEIDIDVTIRQVPTATFNEDRVDGNFDLTFLSFYDYQGFTSDYAYWVLKSEKFYSAYTGYSNAEVDRLIDTIAETSGAERDKAAERMNAIFKEELPWTPVSEYASYSASRVPADQFSTNPATLLYDVR